MFSFEQFTLFWHFYNTCAGQTAGFEISSNFAIIPRILFQPTFEVNMKKNDGNPKSVVRVGVGVFVKDPTCPSKVFCGIRKGSHGAGKLALPG